MSDIIDIKFFPSVEELETFTGWTREELTERGFDLDDVSFIIAVPEYVNLEQSFWQLENMMSNYCTGYTKTKTLLWTYYIVHHS